MAISIVVVVCGRNSMLKKLAVLAVAAGSIVAVCQTAGAVTADQSGLNGRRRHDGAA